MTLDDVEVAVVGGGPAGAVAALTLASEGHDVLLIEKEKYPREKACGDGVIASAASFLTGLGIASVLDGAHPIGDTRLVIDWSTQDSRHRALRSGEARRRGCCLPRSALDARLAEAALNAGARMLQGYVTDLVGGQSGVEGVELMHSGRRARIRARHVVAADGATSRLRRKLVGAAPRSSATAYAVRQYIRTEGAIDPVFELYAPLVESLPGYGWVFPISQRVANVGVGYLIAHGMARPRAITDLLRWFLGELESRRADYLGSIEPLCAPRGGPVAISFDAERCQIGGVVFVGDAARTCDPLTGEGIDEAIRSAHAAALSLHTAIRAKAATVEGVRSYARCRPRLSQDSSMMARLGHELLQRRNASRSGLREGFTELPFLLWSAQSMMDAETDYPSPADTPAGRLASQVGFRHSFRVFNQVLLDATRSPLVLCSELILRDVCAGAGPVAALVVPVTYAGLRDEPSETLTQGALSVELLDTYAATLARVTGGHGCESTFNNAIALAIADLALSVSAATMAKLGASCSAMLAQAIKSRSEAAALLAAARARKADTAEHYLTRAALSGGASMALAARIAAVSAGAALAQVQALTAAGESLGIALQICEDILALMRADPITGRKPRRALEEGDFALPVIFAIEEQPELAGELVEGRDGADWEQMVEAIRKTRGPVRAAAECERYAAAAKVGMIETLGGDSALADICDLPVRCLAEALDRSLTNDRPVSRRADSVPRPAGPRALVPQTSVS